MRRPALLLSLLLLLEAGPGVRAEPAARVRRPPAGARIAAILRSTPAAQRAFWGIEVVEAATGARLFATNPAHLFLPASNAKLFTTALALTRLGPDYRFETSVRAEITPDAAGRLAGDLRLVGGGDPMLSARVIPYQRGPTTGDPLQAIDALAAQVADAGVRRIDGNIVGDDTAYVWEPYPEGWAAGRCGLGLRRPGERAVRERQYLLSAAARLGHGGGGHPFAAARVLRSRQSRPHGARSSDEGARAAASPVPGSCACGER